MNFIGALNEAIYVYPLVTFIICAFLMLFVLFVIALMTEIPQDDAQPDPAQKQADDPEWAALVEDRDRLLEKVAALEAVIEDMEEDYESACYRSQLSASRAEHLQSVYSEFGKLIEQMRTVVANYDKDNRIPF